MSKASDSILRGAREALDYAQGQRQGFVTHVPEHVDVKAIRKRLGLSQAKFAARFGFALDAVKNWEQGRRQPELSAHAFLLVIGREPDAVCRAVFCSSQPNVTGSRKPVQTRLRSDRAVSALAVTNGLPGGAVELAHGPSTRVFPTPAPWMWV